MEREFNGAYLRSRARATFEVYGYTFKVVRRLVVNGTKKGYGPWRNYWAVVINGHNIAPSYYLADCTASDVANAMSAKMHKMFRGKQELAPLLKQYADVQ